MKPVKTLVSVVVLLFALSVNTPAGEQETPGYTAPPPHVTTSDTSAASLDPYSEQTGDTVNTSDYLLVETIAALLSVY